MPAWHSERSDVQKMQIAGQNRPDTQEMQNRSKEDLMCGRC